MQSPAYVRCLGGPIGGGKSVCCAHELMRWASLQAPNSAGVRKSRFLVVRNTADQLRSTTKKTIDDWFPPEQMGHYKATEKTYYYHLGLDDGTQIQSEWMLIALDTPDDIRKALSLEATGLWGNEARELHRDVVDGLLMRVNRYPSMKDGGATRAGAIFDTNMPGMETWWEKQFSNPPKNWSIHIQPEAVLSLPDWIDKYGEDPDEAITGTSADDELFVVDPAHDNYDNLARNYYPNTLEGKTRDFIDVYLRCRFGRKLGGLPVYDKTFSPERHIAKEPLRAIRSVNYPICVGLDFGRTPAAVVGQLTPSGRVSLLSELVATNMGIQKFIATELRPHLFAKYPGAPVIVAPDPAGWAKSQINEDSPVDILRREGFRVARPATNKPALRIEAVEALLMGSIDAGPQLQIDPSLHEVIKGFRGGYRWRTNKAGELAGDNEPLKNQWSHPHDALQYFALVVGSSAYGGAAVPRMREVEPVSAVGWT